MLKITKRLALLAALGVAISSNIADAYMKYAAVYYNPITNKIIRLGGDVHGVYLENGDQYDIQSYKNIKNALKNTNFKPFWVCELHHRVLRETKIGTTFVGTMALLTVAKCLNKQQYKKKTVVIKQSPNLFSQKSFIFSKKNKLFSPIVTDLRESFLSDFLSLLYQIDLGGEKVIDCFYSNMSWEETPVI